MSRLDQLRHVTGLIGRMTSLRTAVIADDSPAGRRLARLLLCGTGLSHRWQLRYTDDGGPYSQSARCHDYMTFYHVRAARDPR